MASMQAYQNNIASGTDVYRLVWPPGTHVVVHVQSNKPLEASVEAIHPSSYIPELGRTLCEGEKETSFGFSVPENTDDIRIALQTPDAIEFVRYGLRFEPAPTKVRSVPKPGLTREAMVAKILEESQPEEESASPDASKALEQELLDYRIYAMQKTSLRAFAPIKLETVEGYSYRILLRKDPLSSFSPIATRGLAWRIRTSKGTVQHRARVAGSLVLGPSLDRLDGGWSTVELVPSRCKDCELGTGDVGIEIYRRADDPKLFSREAFVKALEEVKKTHKPGTPWTGNLSELESVAFQAQDGVCRTLVMELAPNAQWSPTLRGFIATTERPSFHIVDVSTQLHTHTTGIVGPGAVADFGCLGAGTTRVTFEKTGQERGLGTGRYVATWYTRALSTRQLEAERCAFCQHRVYVPPYRVDRPSVEQKTEVAYQYTRFQECVAAFAPQGHCAWP